MPQMYRTHVAAVILVTDPAKNSGPSHLLLEGLNEAASLQVWNANGVWDKAFSLSGWSPAIPADVIARTVEICHNNDPVCAPGCRRRLAASSAAFLR